MKFLVSFSINISFIYYQFLQSIVSTKIRISIIYEINKVEPLSPKIKKENAKLRNVNSLDTKWIN